MKRFIAVMIAVLMLAMTAFAGTAMADGEGDLAGVWYVQSMIQDGMEVDASFIVSMGMSITLTLNEDGTASMEMTGQDKQEGTWTSDGTTGTIAFASEIPFTVDGETIVMTQPNLELEEGQTAPVMVFGREEPKAESMAPAVEGAKLSDFNGTWNATSIMTFGFPLPLAAMGGEITMTLDEGKAAVNVVTRDLENHGEIKDTMEKEFTAEMTDEGTLYVDFGGDDILSAIQMQGSGIYLTLHEDGRLSGEIPEVTEAMKEMQAMSEESANQAAEQAESAEPAEGEAADAEEPAVSVEGDSSGEAGDSGESASSGGESMEMYLIFEKAE